MEATMEKGQRLVESDKVMRCSACGFPFSREEFPDIPRAFQDHVASFHQPKRKQSQQGDPEG
jgi:hypothetical protein